ncbi:MAG: hypothetical protein AVDCRST_MAG62-87, partial [uncultured Sphingomonas sp.]
GRRLFLARGDGVGDGRGGRRDTAFIVPASARPLAQARRKLSRRLGGGGNRRFRAHVDQGGAGDRAGAGSGGGVGAKTLGLRGASRAWHKRWRGALRML